MACGRWAARSRSRRTRQLSSHKAGSRPSSTAWEVRPYQRLEAEGVYDAEHQFLLDNIILNSRYGHYVLTPLAYSDDEPVLIVNRGWVERTSGEIDPTVIEVSRERVSVRGRVGSLPKAGYRMGESIEFPDNWPQHAVYPTLDELAASLGRSVEPFVLLMDPEEDHGLLRHWVPEEMGPGRHYAYAFQWFAMGSVLAGLLVWNYRKRGIES